MTTPRRSGLSPWLWALIAVSLSGCLAICACLFVLYAPALLAGG